MDSGSVLNSEVKIVVADDDNAIRLVLKAALEDEGWGVFEVGNVPDMINLLKEGKGDVLVSDVIMPGGNGLDCLSEIKLIRPDLPIIVISAQNTLGTAIRATSEGCFDYLSKPFDLDDLTKSVCNALKFREKSTSGKAQNVNVGDESDKLSLIGSSNAMQRLYKSMARVVQTDLTVLIQGESGTGKELVARAIHQHGKRSLGPFIAVNMASIPDDLVENELFGHEKGAYTGATSREKGKFGQASGGTLFLDEIGDMPFSAQTSLLRVLQEGEYQAIGGQDTLQADVRIITATHQNLNDLVKQKKFREDLYHRLNVVPLMVPPLRDRLEDIESLGQHFLDKAASQGLLNKKMTTSAIDVLKKQHWPGNVRELENLLHRVSALYSEDEISAEILIAELNRNNDCVNNFQQEEQAIGVSLGHAISFHLEKYFVTHDKNNFPKGLYQRLLKEFEKPLIEKVLIETNGNQLKASDILGLNRNTLRKKITELDIILENLRKN